MAMNGLSFTEFARSRESGMVETACVQFRAFSRELPSEISVGCVGDPRYGSVCECTVELRVMRIAGGTAEECPSSPIGTRAYFLYFSVWKE